MTEDHQSKLTLIEVVLHIINSKQITNPQEIFSEMQTYALTFSPNPITLKLYLRKLAFQRLLKHQFVGNEYEISLTDKGVTVLDVLKHKLII